MPELREVYGEAKLASDMGAGFVSASEDGEGGGDAAVQEIRASGEELKLVSAEARVAREASVGFCAKREAIVEVVSEREASGVDVAFRIRGADDTGAGVTSEEIAEVSGETGGLAEGFLPDHVEPVIDMP